MFILPITHISENKAARVLRAAALWTIHAKPDRQEFQL